MELSFNSFTGTYSIVDARTKRVISDNMVETVGYTTAHAAKRAMVKVSERAAKRTNVTIL